MQRNWDVIRKSLLKVEQLPDAASEVDSSDIDGVDSETAAYHLRLMIEAGLIVGGCRESLGPAWCYATRLTWAGHEFLDQIRRDTAWNRIKTTARERGIDLAYDTIKAIAAKVTAGVLG